MKKRIFIILLGIWAACFTLYSQEKEAGTYLTIDKNTFLPFKKYITAIQYKALGDAGIKTQTIIIDKNTLYVKVIFTLDKQVQQNDWHLNLIPAFTPTFDWTPHLTPTDEHIIAQHVFRSPALIATDSSHTMVLIPDLDIMQQGTPVSWYMDLDAKK
ncbi:MAG: hypothetical protein ACK5HT_17840, partial [Draconibacterium sp.]